MPRVSRRRFVTASAAHYPTQKRTLKDSARWYRDVIASNGASLPA
jgi:beta-glucosidase/6-phospho-beta-glucosidase/beta-galactosidase